MDRRSFFKTSGRKKSSFRVQGGIDPYGGAWTRDEVSHLLKRALFGARETDIQSFVSMGPEAAIDALFQPQPLPASPLREYGMVGVEGFMYDDLGVAVGQPWGDDLNTASDPQARPAINSARNGSLIKWMMGLMLHQNATIHEKMVLFMHHHFSVQMGEVDNATMCYRHHMLLRQHAVGNIRELTRLVSKDPAMLRHLNGYLNSKKAPDENFARELQELMTVGKGTDSLYTENDVIAAAKVLTGWRIDDATKLARFEASEHDMSTKQFSGFYKGVSISAGDGDTELAALINMIFGVKETARFICRKLYRWFVYHRIEADVETAVIQPLADLLIAEDYELEPVLKVLLRSDHFYETARRASYIKNPYDFIVGTLREFNVSFPAMADYSVSYPYFEALAKQGNRMLMGLFQPPDVSGWPAYYQEPMFYEMWVNSNSLPRRADFINGVVADGVVDVRAYANESGSQPDARTLVETMAGRLLQYPLSATSIDYIVNRFCPSGMPNDAQLKDIFTFIMNLPEYHLC
ncbi:MAG TPA: DUF1800 domain-containing protein, partial [Flavihumibacter sp.]|nr:DUF1800 domain-containing protein [Flavihumibacter sp.]